jgi:hypothetical protein
MSRFAVVSRANQVKRLKKFQSSSSSEYTESSGDSQPKMINQQPNIG